MKFPAMARVLLVALAALILAFLILSLTDQAGATDDPGNLEQQIRREKTRADKTRAALTRLSKKERAIYGDLAKLERKVARLAETLRAKERDRAGLTKKRQGIEARTKELEGQRDALGAELSRLMPILWSARTANMATGPLGYRTWDEADRRFAWLTALAATAKDKRVQAEILMTDLRQSRDEAAQAEAALDTNLKDMGATRDELRASRLAMLRRIQEVRAEKLSAEEGLEAVLGTIATLDARLKEAALAREQKSNVTRPTFRGKLPWPARGRILKVYNPRATPPSRGMGMAVTAGTTVSAVDAGRVVHDDLLRGFGRVIIVSHNDNAYSLYAFLADATVRVGQRVTQGQPLGSAGFYPEADGPGLYFELRSGQKPINPADWLAD
jgi:septal ring factor EnvC (AmiA/AmiB activator)